MALQNPSPERVPVLSFVGPGGDLLFWEKVDIKNKRVFDTAIGEPHWDSAKYPNHELVFKTPLDSAGQWHKFYYAADRANQDAYNWEISGDELVRTYLIRRDKYRQKAAAFSPLLAGEFTYPPAGTADATFTSYAFADDSLTRTGEELDNTYVVVKRRLIRPVVTDIVWNDQLKKNVIVTKTIKPSTTTATSGTSGSGVVYELRDGNFYHKVEIKQEVDLDGASYPYSIETLPGVQNYRFPAKLDSVNLVNVWAYAYSSGSAPAFSEDYYFKFKIIEPRPGPYSATITRFITNDPSAIKTDNPVTIVPQPVNESIAVVGGWWQASTDGNSASATAKEWSVPGTIHEQITVTVNSESDADAGIDYPATKIFTETLDATPGVTAFLALSVVTVGFEVQELPFGLYEVSVIKIDISNLYDEP